MVAWCVVPNCKGAKSAASGVFVSYHHFPTQDADRCREWLRRIDHPKYDEHTPPGRLKNLRVCGLHFREEDFCKSMMARIMGTAEKRRLHTDANPSIFTYRRSSSGCEYETSEVPGPPEERSWTDENAAGPASETVVLTASTSATEFLPETFSEVVPLGDTHSCNNDPESPAAAITEVIGFTDESDFSDEEENSMSENNSDSDWVPAKDHSIENEITDSDSGTNEIDEEDGTAVGLKLRQLCPECGKFFNIQKAHTCEYKFKHYSCNVCGKRFVTEHHLKSHSNIHKDGYKHKCMFCLKTFKTRPDKLAHEQSHPRVKKPYECPDCPEVFAKSRERNNHLLAHRGPEKYICHTCNMEFPHNAALERHMLVHTGAKEFVCEVCQRSFSQASHLKSHVRVHTGEKPYQCQHCDKGFNHNVSLKSHIQRYHGQVPNPGMDVQMEKPRRNESAAELDETNEMENNAALFICHICNMEFPYSGVLEKHVVVQTGEKQFVCEACQRSFKWDDDEEEKKDEEKKGRTKKGHKWYTGRPKGRPKRNAVITSDVTYKLKRKSCDGDSASDSADEEEEKRGRKRMKKTTRRSKGRAQIYGAEEQSSDSEKNKKTVGLETVRTEGDEEGSCC